MNCRAGDGEKADWLSAITRHFLFDHVWCVRHS